AASDYYGRSAAGQACPVNVEFVSANPTGPLHVGHGRQAALGDAISSLLSATGWKVTREFYYNDAGAQITSLSLSVQARVRELRGIQNAIPEGGYHGEYIRDIAQRYADDHPIDSRADDLDAVRRFTVQELRKEQDRDLEAFDVQGSDHPSTVTRVRIGLQALDMGIPEGYPEYALHQMVTVMRAGDEVKISKRAGSYVTVRDLIDEVGRDAVRYFFLMRKGDS